MPPLGWVACIKAPAKGYVCGVTLSVTMARCSSYGTSLYGYCHGWVCQLRHPLHGLLCYGKNQCSLSYEEHMKFVIASRVQVLQSQLRGVGIGP